jgi:hypothetical protein
MKIIRVFPRKTNATPTDELAFVGNPTMFAEADEIHISVTFSWDIPEAERLEKEWRRVALVKIGGPAIGQRVEICRLFGIRADLSPRLKCPNQKQKGEE